MTGCAWPWRRRHCVKASGSPIGTYGSPPRWPPCRTNSTPPGCSAMPGRPRSRRARGRRRRNSRRWRLDARPAFVLANGTGDKAVFSGSGEAAPLIAAAEALLTDEARRGLRRSPRRPPRSNGRRLKERGGEMQVAGGKISRVNKVGLLSPKFGHSGVDLSCRPRPFRQPLEQSDASTRRPTQPHTPRARRAKSDSATRPRTGGEVTGQARVPAALSLASDAPGTGTGTREVDVAGGKYRRAPCRANPRRMPGRCTCRN